MSSKTWVEDQRAASRRRLDKEFVKAMAKAREEINAEIRRRDKEGI